MLLSAELPAPAPVTSDREPGAGAGGPVSFVVAGLLDEAPDYVDALVREVEGAWSDLSAWWGRWGNRPLELRGELWGAGSSTRLAHDGHALRCLVQRAPDSTWGGDDPRTLARDDLDDALLLLARTFDLPVPPVRPGPGSRRSPRS